MKTRRASLECRSHPFQVKLGYPAQRRKFQLENWETHQGCECCVCVCVPVFPTSFRARFHATKKATMAHRAWKKKSTKHYSHCASKNSDLQRTTRHDTKENFNVDLRFELTELAVHRRKNAAICASAELSEQFFAGLWIVQVFLEPKHDDQNSFHYVTIYTGSYTGLCFGGLVWQFHFFPFFFFSLVLDSCNQLYFLSIRLQI